MREEDEGEIEWEKREKGRKVKSREREHYNLVHTKKCGKGSSIPQVG